MKRVPVEPVLVSHLFPEMRAELLRVLESLTDEEWKLPTACEGWSVRDVAAHILADDIGLLSNQRDHDGQHFKVESFDELVALINGQNDAWVKTARRMSRRVLIAFLEMTGQPWHEFVVTIDPFAMAGAIGWKGSDPDPKWIHIARELTEYWMHHQHICEAVGKTSLREVRYVQPVLSTFAHAFPHTYRNTQAPIDTLVKIVIQDVGAWHVVCEAEGWKLYAVSDLTPTTIVTLDVDTAWHMFTKGRTIDELRQRAMIEGDIHLGQVALTTVAIIA
jgi:uncharacterized protein (TIGR03083 family)